MRRMRGPLKWSCGAEGSEQKIESLKLPCVKTRTTRQFLFVLVRVISWIGFLEEEKDDPRITRTNTNKHLRFTSSEVWFALLYYVPA